MSETFLEKILESTRRRIAALSASVDITELSTRAEEMRSSRLSGSFLKTLEQGHRTNIIAEIKRASPSKGVINDQIDVRETAMEYRDGGACAISVLTEEMYFRGSLADLAAARDAVEIPILRKDFILDPVQIYEAAAAGADAVLLIVAILEPEDLQELRSLAQELGLDALIEVHSLAELEVAGSIGATLIGVNNRDLRSFDVSLDVSRELIHYKPAGSLMIAESGISSKKQIEELRPLGFDGFLIGETLMQTSGRQTTLEELVS